MSWQTKAFKDLTVDEYFEILYLRIEIFVVEQDCPYQEVDEKDRISFHLFGRAENGDVIAVTRILPQGVSYDEISVGRVALKKEYRGKGIADELMLETFKFIKSHFGEQPVRISAQQYLLNYYNKHGFRQVGDMYLEDDIPHVEMICK
ncbi:MAG: GNAT family N-acetyltransferase [Gammaproteobacteria bacterium]|nr:MAG: GNAT family N-acetyltransferase [Gammaproteobacteria bacterium]